MNDDLLHLVIGSPGGYTAGAMGVPSPNHLLRVYDIDTRQALQGILETSSLCVIQGLQTQPGKLLNGRLAQVMTLDEQAGRLCVRLHPADPKRSWKKWKPDNVKTFVDADDMLEFARFGLKPFCQAFDVPYLSSWLPKRISICRKLVDIHDFDFDSYPIYSHPLWRKAKLSVGLALVHMERGNLETVARKLDVMIKAMSLLQSDPDVEALNHCSFIVGEPGVNFIDMPSQSCIRRIEQKLTWIRWSVLTAFVFGKRLTSLAEGSPEPSRPRAEKELPASVPASVVDVVEVVEVVDHQGEAAAVRDAQLLEEQAEHDWADQVERGIQRGPDAGSDFQGGEQIFLYPYKRAPAEFMEALLRGPELKNIRAAMLANDCPVVLEGGAKIFVWPEQYQTVLQSVREQGITLRASYVIASESIFPQIEASIATIPSQKNVRIKKDGIVALTGAVATHSDSTTDETAKYVSVADATEDEESWDEFLQIERTFICISNRVLRSAHSVNQSTTEAHGGVNPRRLA